MLKQEVTLLVHDQPTGGNLLLDASGLRVDFDIRLIPKFSRATFTIYNLSEETIRVLMDGDRYVTLKTRLHGGKESVLANRFTLNNATDELKLPDRITTLFCFDSLRRNVLETQVDIEVKNPTLERMVRQLLAKSNHTGGIDFKTFPTGLLGEAGLRESRPLQGSTQQCLRKLEKEFNFETFTLDGGFTFLYKPDIENVAKTDLTTKSEIVTLQTKAMRSNPKVGIATATIESNLDPSLSPTTTIDLSNLATVAVEASQQTLEMLDRYLKNFSGYSRYQIFSTQHKGSNYTDQWHTVVSALSPTKGKLMNTVAWSKAYDE